ncbi:MAG: hypothetical protein IT452_02925 [Planctomycetia bacterium]|nr:hypothetical protein [Planctomycetia bacterium]
MRRSTLAVLALTLVLAGCRKAAAPPPPAPAPASSGGAAAPAPQKPAAFRGEWRASLKGADIPDVPAGGQVRGREFTVEIAEFENGILHLKQGKEFFADLEFVVFLFTKEKGSIPENRTWEFEPERKFDRPHIHLGYKKPGENMPSHDMFMSGYSMKLELGKESGKKIPGRIWLCVEAEAKEGEPAGGERKSWVAGTFTATVKGFILRNGQADRTEDALELLPWLMEERLKKENPGQAVAVTNSAGGMMTTGEKTGSGSVDVEWTLAGAKKGWLKARFEKKNGEWAVSKVWPGNQIPEAHPDKVPDLKAKGPEGLRYLAAVELEKMFAGKIVHMQGALYPNAKDGVAAACQVGGQVEGEDDWFQKTLLFKWTENGWAFDRVLAEGERFNAATGAVEK